MKLFNRKTNILTPTNPLALTLGNTEAALLCLQSQVPKPILKAQQTFQAESPSELQHKIAAFIQKNRLSHSSCSLVLNSSQYQLFMIDSLNVPDEELAEAAKWRIKDLLDIPLENAAVQAFVIPAHGPGNKRKKTYVAVADLTLLLKLRNQIEDLNLQLKAININELALRNIITHLNPGSKTQALFNLSEYRGDIMILKDGDIYLTRAIELSISKLTKLATEKQERLLEAFLLEIQRSFDYCESTLGIAAPDVLYFLSSAMGQEQLLKHLKANLTANVLTISANELVEGQIDVDLALLGETLGTKVRDS